MTVKDKAVGFYQVSVLANGRRELPKIDWRSHLQRVAELPMPDRTHDGVIYDPHVTDDALTLGVHALIKPDFMTNVDTADATITDLMDEVAQTDGPNKRLANSTAVVFLPTYNVAAVATGTNQSPKPPKVVTDFLEIHVPLEQGAHWVVHPLMDSDKIRRFREESQGVAYFESRITTVRDLFTPEESEGIARYADELADRIGGNVTIEISVKLAPESRGRSTMQRFRDLVLGDLPRVAGNPASRTKVTALLAGNVEEEMNLVASRLAATIPIDTSVSESRRFSTLMEHLHDVSGSMEDRIKQLFEG